MKFLIVSLIATLLTTTAHAQALNGAGATFPAPIYSKWAEESKSAGFVINYQAIGSGGGQNQIINGTVDFGASDAPLSQEKLNTHNLIQVPTVMGSVVVIVNLPGITNNTLKISGQTLVDIYQGKITKWNDPAILADNLGLKLPNLAIAPVYRADGSGTTFVFVSYLHSQNKDFSVPAVSIKWNAGSGARGNDGVAATVKRMTGSIGYVESVFATNNNIPTAVLKSATGKWVSPTSKTFIAAANKAEWSDTNEADSLNMKCDECYPIISATYILIPKNSKKLSDITSWLEWIYKNGNPSAILFDFIPLSDYTKSVVIKQLRK